MSPARRVLLCIDDSDASEDAVRWAMAHVYREGDELHIVHVIPRYMLTGAYGVPPVDYLPSHMAHRNEELIKSAEAFIVRRALRHMEGVTEPKPVVHVIKYETDADSIGELLCRKAEELDAAVMVLSQHDKTRVQQIFLGSVSNYCTHHCKRSVIVHR